MKKIKDLKPTDREVVKLFLIGLKKWPTPIKIIGKETSNPMFHSYDPRPKIMAIEEAMRKLNEKKKK